MKFGRTLAEKTVKRDNAPGRELAKIQLRKALLNFVGLEHAAVFDAFAGEGHMYYEAWKAAAVYRGCDERWFPDERCCYVADNRRVLRCADLKPYNIFDLDSYGSPWEQALLIAERRPVAAGERIGVALTEGSGLKIKMGQFPIALCEIAGLKQNTVGGSRSRDELLMKAIKGLAKRMRCQITRVQRAQSRRGAYMAYAGVMLTGSSA